MSRLSLADSIKGLREIGYTVVNKEKGSKGCKVMMGDKVIKETNNGRELVAFYRTFLPESKKSNGVRPEVLANKLAVEMALTSTTKERKHEIALEMQRLLVENASDLHEETSSMISQMYIREL